MGKRIIFFFDGFNLWHALDHNPALGNKTQYRKYKWLNPHRLAQCFVPLEEIAGIYYFTAFANWDPNKVARHKTYISALRSVGAKIIFGNFKLSEGVKSSFDTCWPPQPPTQHCLRQVGKEKLLSSHTFANALLCALPQPPNL